MFSKPSVTIHVEQKLHNTNNYKLVCKLNRGSALFHKPNQHINVNWLALSCIVFWNYLFKFMSFNLSTSPDCFIQQGVHDRQTSGLSFARVHQVPTFSHTCGSVIWLVVWNIFNFSIYWECHHPNWLYHIFQRGRSTTNQFCFFQNTDDLVFRKTRSIPPLVGSVRLTYSRRLLIRIWSHELRHGRSVQMFCHPGGLNMFKWVWVDSG